MKQALLALWLLFFSNSLISQHFQPVWQTPFNPMNIYVTAADLNGNPLNGMDEIGVFDADGFGNEICVGAVVLDSPIPQGEFVQIICSMDDGIDPGNPNGFTSGNDLIFRYWINVSGEEITDVECSFPFPDYDEQFAALGTAIVALSATTQVPLVQLIDLNQGWSGISSYLNPENPVMDQIFSALENDLIIIKNLGGEYYQPSGEVSLSDWNIGEGYFIKMANLGTLEITGFQPESTEITIYAGWNLIPVLTDQDIAITDLFLDQLSKVIIIKEGIGTDVFWPEKEIFKLQNFQSGRSYLLKASELFTIDFSNK